MSLDSVEKIEFAGATIALLREEQVCQHLSLDDAILDSRAALEQLARQMAVNRARVRVEWEPRDDKAWLHTLRAGLSSPAVVGGKDYTSLRFETPAMWVTVVDVKTALPLALIESQYLSRIRTAATTAIATDLLAPTDAACLAHFGAGKISELLVRAVLKVRPSVRRVFLVRHDPSNGAPPWLERLEGEVKGEMRDASDALLEADIVTTATSSKKRTLAIPRDAALPFVRHINLVGSNHLARREISQELALRCLPPEGYLVVEDQRQAELEAGDFAGLKLSWDDVPTLAQVLVDKAQQRKAADSKLTAFKSVGIGLMDLAVATGVLRRTGLFPVLDSCV